MKELKPKQGMLMLNSNLHLTLDPIPEDGSSVLVVSQSLANTSVKENEIWFTTNEQASSSLACVSTMGDVVEYSGDAEQRVSSPARCRMPWKYIILLGFLVTAVTVAIVLVIKFDNESENVQAITGQINPEVPSTAPASSPEISESATNATTSRDVFMQELDDLFLTLSGDTIQDPVTPQGKARLWFFNDSLTISNNRLDQVVQRYALCVLYFALSGPEWTGLPFLNSSLDECKWGGVECSNNTVVGIGRANNNLVGSIPKEIGLLTQLTALSMYNNSLSAEIPECLWNMTNLNHIDLSQNMLNGAVPRRIGLLSNLDVLLLHKNTLQGSLPKEIGNLKNITVFSVASNSLTGQLPESLWFLSSLLWLDVSKNDFTGTLSPGIWSLLNVESLFLSENSLTGSIPKIPSTITISSVLELHLFTNSLTGTIPASLSLLHNSLQRIVLFGNELSGTIPSTFSNLTQLTYVDLSKNNLVGKIPIFHDSVMKMYLSHNDLTGTLPERLPANAVEVRMNSNSLTGTIPSDFAVGLKNLTDLMIHYNKLKGEIPSALCEQENFFVESGSLEVDCSDNSSSYFVRCGCCTQCH